MTPSIGSNEVIHSPGPITLGIFADSGWVVGCFHHLGRRGEPWSKARPDTRNMRFNVSLSVRPTAHTVTAHFTTGNSTAIAGTDYNRSQERSASPPGPPRVRSTSAFAVTTSSNSPRSSRWSSPRPPARDLGRKSVSGSILDDDPGPELQISVGKRRDRGGRRRESHPQLTVTLSSTSTHAIASVMRHERRKHRREPITPRPRERSKSPAGAANGHDQRGDHAGTAPK